MSDQSVPDDFEAMTRVHVDALWRTALRMTGSRESADDLVQETCLRALRSFDRYQTGTNYKAWLFRIMTNVCKDIGRREARSPFQSWDDAQVEIVTAKHAQSCKALPEDELQNHEFVKDAHQALLRLPPNIRMVVSLSLLSEHTYSEIALMMNIPVGTVRSRLSRGRLYLQRELLAHRTEESALASSPAPSGSNATSNTVASLFPDIAKQKA